MLVGMGDHFGERRARRELRDGADREPGDQGEREQMTCRILRLRPPFEEGPEKGASLYGGRPPCQGPGVTLRPQSVRDRRHRK